MSKCGSSIAPPGWWCTRDVGHEGPCAAWPDRWQNHPETLDRMLYSGVPYGVVGSEVCEGSEVCPHYDGFLCDPICPAYGHEKSPATTRELLRATNSGANLSIRCHLLRRYARMCATAAKVCRFLKLTVWEDLFKRAEAGFIADVNYVRNVANSYRSQYRGPEGTSPSSPQP